MKPTELGRVGEDIAVTYLQKQGFRILASNSGVRLWDEIKPLLPLW